MKLTEKILDILQTYGMMVMLMVSAMSIEFLTVYFFGISDPARFLMVFSFSAMFNTAFIIATPFTLIWFLTK